MDKMKVFYILAILGVLSIWVGGVVVLEVNKAEVDRGFVTQVSGICLLVLGQIANMLKNSSDNKQTKEEVKDVIKDIQ